MSYIDRKNKILALLDQTGAIRVDALTKLLYASSSTVRLDLARLWLFLFQ